MQPIFTPTARPETAQKGGVIDGALVTEEVMESSKSLLDKNRAGGTKGAQQYYSPEELAEFVKRMMPGNMAILDPTAGDGSLLRKFDTGYSFGIEIDADQVNNSEGSYKAIRGDFQHVYTLLRRADVVFEGIVANPPFDLKWQDPSIEDNKELSSTRLTFIAINRLLDTDGQFVFVCGRDRFNREIAELDVARERVYAVLEVEDLFDGVALPCVIVCGMHDEARRGRNNSEGWEVKQVTRGTLDLASSWVQERRVEANGWGSLATSTRDTTSLSETWKAVQTEYNRRVEKRLGKYKREFDLFLTGSTLNAIISPYGKIILSKTNQLRTIEGLHKHNVNYFRQNEAAWRHVTEAAEDGHITIDPKLVEIVDALLADNRRIAAPLYALKPIQRLGFLSEVDRIKCTRTDEENGFYAGERYAIHTQPSTFEVRVRRFEANKKTGEWQEKFFVERRKRLMIQISGASKHKRFYDDDEHAQDIQYLADHFEIPDPGDVGSRFPDETHAMRMLLWQIMWDTIIPNSAKWDAADDPEVLEAIERGELEIVTYNDPDMPLLPTRKWRGIQLRKFQVEDIARMLVKGSGLLAWEQGLGKTLAALVYTEACIRLGAQDAAYFIVPQDLIPQWQRESQRFMGKELTLIANRDIKIPNPEKGKGKRKIIKHTIPVHAVAKEVDTHIRKGGEGWYITYFEAISTIGTKKENLPHVVVTEKDVPGKQHPGQYVHDQHGNWVWKDGETEPDTTRQVYSDELCPSCHADLRDGWNGEFCESKDERGKMCGYTHVAAKIRPAGTILSSTFKHGVVVVDEVTAIQGDDSHRSKVIRGTRAAHRLGMTGTPIKNYVSQAFWLLRWAIDQKRFSYSWLGGRTKFEDDFSVVEWNVTKGTKANRRSKPDVTNLSMLWKLLASSVIRRRKEETGEPIVAKRYHEHLVPLGVQQRQQMQKWMRDFHLFFAEKYPDSKVVKSGAHIPMAPMLGMKPKLEYAATMPLADPDHDWTGIEVSNWTPANLRTLELAMALAKEGRKVLVGSATKETGRWLADQLSEKGVNAVHILDADGTTYSPKKRAEVVHAFQTDEVQVFCAGIAAIRLGHNLDKGSAVIIHGPPWDWESFDQFIARVHRLTSERDVDVHIVLPHGTNETLSEKKWELLQQKGQAAELALDGRLLEKDTEKTNEESVMQELVEKGITASADEIEEDEIEAAWSRLPEFADYVAPAGFTKGRTVPTRPTDWTIWQSVFGDTLKDIRALPVKAMADCHGPMFTPAEPEPVKHIPVGIGIAMSDFKLPKPTTNGHHPEPTADIMPEPTGPEPEPAPEPEEKVSIVSELKGLAELHREGILDDDEFKTAKAALLATIGAKAAA